MLSKLLQRALPRATFATAQSRRVSPKYTKLFINNEWVDAQDGRTFDTVSPSTEEKICSVARAGDADAEKAIHFARKAFDDPKSEWRNMSQNARGRLLNRLADLIERDRETLAGLETLDNGKPYWFSRDVDVALAVKTYRYYAGWADKIHGSTIPVDGPFTAYTRQEPVGVAAQIIPWNFPLLMQAWKWGPCLATGSVSILKTSEKTPLTALHIASLAKEAGFPAGVVQVLSGYGDVGQYLVRHKDVDKVAFTGSTKVGFDIMRNAPSGSLKRVTLELGGKSPNIICHDADIEEAVNQNHLALFLNQGQCCCAGSRTFVHEKIYDRFVEAAAAKARTIKLGDPFEEGTQQGPQVDDKQFNSVLGYIKTGQEEGAKLVTGGKRWGNKGYFIEPTIFANVKDDMKIAREEIFGPVMQIIKFSSYEEVVKRANDTVYGLAAGIVTKDIDVFHQLANGIRAGTVWANCYDVLEVNTPFGGYKASGIGRENGEQALRNYLETKCVIVKHGPNTLP